MQRNTSRFCVSTSTIDFAFQFGIEDFKHSVIIGVFDNLRQSGENCTIEKLNTAAGLVILTICLHSRSPRDIGILPTL